MKGLANCGFTLSVKSMMMMTMMVITLMMVMLTMVVLLSSRNLRYQNIFAKLFGELFNWHCCFDVRVFYLFNSLFTIKSDL